MVSNSFYIDCDPQIITQVVFNLLDNAMKFTSNGQIIISIDLASDKYFNHNPNLSLYTDNKILDTFNTGATSTTKDISEYGNKIIVTVQDTGEGVDDRIKKHLFEKFATVSLQGSGLGLYLSKKMVEYHQGKMWFEEPNNSIRNEDNNIINTEYNTGSIFRFSLPISIDKR